MKINRKQLRMLLEQETKKALTKDAVKQQIVKTVGNAEPAGEGGAAGYDPIKKDLEALAKEEDATMPEELDDDEEIKAFIRDEIDNIKQHDSGDYVETDGLKESIRQLVRESLEKVGFYKKYSYGLDDIPDPTKAHDAIIGHT